MEMQSNHPNLLGVNSQTNLLPSPSASNFLPEEDASTCPLLASQTPSPPLAFSHPLTSSGGDIDSQMDSSNNGEDTKAEEEISNSSASSSGIVMDVADSVFNKLAYQQYLKNGNDIVQVGWLEVGWAWNANVLRCVAIRERQTTKDEVKVNILSSIVSVCSTRLTFQSSTLVCCG